MFYIDQLAYFLDCTVFRRLWLVRTLISKENLVGRKGGWESDFSKIKILENPDLFTNLALHNLVQIFGEDKRKTFEAVRFMVPAIPENDLKRIRKCFFSCIDTFLGNKDKLRKNKSKLEPFFDSTSFFKDLFFKAGDLPSETVSPAAPEADLYPNRWAPLKDRPWKKSHRRRAYSL